MLSNNENLQQSIINGLVVDKHNDIKNKAQQDLYNTLEQNKLRGEQLANQDQISKLDGSVHNLRGINNRLRDELKTKEDRIKELEEAILVQSLAFDDAFSEIFIELAETEEKKQDAKKSLEKLKQRARQIEEIRRNELIVKKTEEENIPKQLKEGEMLDYSFLCKTYYLLKEADKLKCDEYEQRFNYWYAEGLYQDMVVPQKQLTKPIVSK